MTNLRINVKDRMNTMTWEARHFSENIRGFLSRLIVNIAQSLEQIFLELMGQLSMQL